jgi:tRNA-binding protein
VTIAWADFDKVDMRVGVVTSAQEFPEARRPAYKLESDFGAEIGVKRSSAQITRHYRAGDLLGRRVVAVVNFPPKRVGPFVSEVLVLGAYDADGEVVLLAPDRPVAPGSRIG